MRYLHSQLPDGRERGAFRLMSRKLLALVACALTCGCLPEQPRSAFTAQVERIQLLELAANIEAYRGRSVRTCAPRTSRLNEPLEWQLTGPGRRARHPGGVLVVACDRNWSPAPNGTCVTGRVARRDGSIEPLREGESRIVSSATIDYTWYLHAQYPNQRF